MGRPSRRRRSGQSRAPLHEFGRVEQRASEAFVVHALRTGTPALRTAPCAAGRNGCGAQRRCVVHDRRTATHHRSSQPRSARLFLISRAAPLPPAPADARRRPVGPPACTQPIAFLSMDRPDDPRSRTPARRRCAVAGPSDSTAGRAATTGRRGRMWAAGSWYSASDRNHDGGHRRAPRASDARGRALSPAEPHPLRAPKLPHGTRPAPADSTPLLPANAAASGNRWPDRRSRAVLEPAAERRVWACCAAEELLLPH